MEPSTQSLEEALSSLSLRGLNTEREQNQLENLIHDHLLPNLQRCQNMSRLSPDDPFFQEARDIWERENWNGEGLSNYIRLLCGVLNFPAILLLNPSGWDHLPWNEMIQNSPTLTWLQQMLEPWGFTLRDIIIIDAFPLLTDRDMDAMEDAERLRLPNEVFNLTVKFLRRFELPVIVSCQCSTKITHPRWGVVNHPLAALLCSSVGGARCREVANVPLDERAIHVVQGFHPMRIEREEDPEIRGVLDQVLRSILETLYRPCAEWKDQRRQECEENLHTATEEVGVTMAAFLDALTVYRRYQRRATMFGVDSARLGMRYDSPEWIKFRHNVRLFVSTLLPASL